MTKKELAERINVDPKTIKNWETSKPELIKLINLGLEVEKQLGSIDLPNFQDINLSQLDLMKIINLGLTTNEHIKETEEYLKKMKKTKTNG